MPKKSKKELKHRRSFGRYNGSPTVRRQKGNTCGAHTFATALRCCQKKNGMVVESHRSIVKGITDRYGTGSINFVRVIRDECQKRGGKFWFQVAWGIGETTIEVQQNRVIIAEWMATSA